MNFRIFVIVMIFTALFFKTKAQNLPLDTAVRTGTLKNGFTYFIRHNEEPKNRVVMYMVNKVGSVLEDEDQRGLAHFVEHMSFNGTKHFPHNELIDYLQKSGVRFGADINAYTNFDETVYELPIPSDKPELLKNGLNIMRDWAQEATLDPTEIDKERGVVLEEKRLGKSAGERMRRIYLPLVLNNSIYANRNPIGLDTVLNNFKRPVISRFYNDWYRPDLQGLIIVGDVDVNAIEQIIKKEFASLKNPIHERKRIVYTVPLTGKNQFIVATDPELTSIDAEILIKHKLLPLKTARDYYQSILRALFNQMIDKRYAELSIQANPPFVSSSVSISDFMGGLNLYDASLRVKGKELEKGIKAMWRETERVKRFGFTSSELARAKAAYLNGMKSLLNEKNKIPSETYVKEYLDYFLKGTAAPGLTAEYSLAETDLNNISLNEVNALAKEYITNTDRDILLLAPEKNKGDLPDEATVNTWLKSVEEEDLQPYQDNVNSQPLISVSPIPGKIIAQRKDTQTNTILIKLSNGVKVYLKPTDFKNDQILFTAFAPGGTSLYSDADFQSAANAGGLIPANGVGNYNFNQLGKFLEGKQFDVKPYINERFEGINGSSTSKDLQAALEMTYAYFTEPRKDPAIFKNIISRTQASLANRSNDPTSVFSDTVSAILGNHNIRRTGPNVDKLNLINPDRAFEIYKERFADAGNFTFTFVGSIDTGTIKPLLEKYLGSLPATNQHAQEKDLNIHAPNGKIEKTVYKGSEPKSSVILVFSGKYISNAENNVKLDALKETLEIRLLQRLREEESGVYSPGVSQNTSKFPQQRYSFSIRFGCAPQNVEKLIASTLDEIRKLRTNGPPQENIDKWRAETLTAFEPQLKTNPFWLSYINGQLQNDGPLDQVFDYKTIIDKVNSAGVKEIAERYLSGENFIQFVLKPEGEQIKQ